MLHKSVTKMTSIVCWIHCRISAVFNVFWMKQTLSWTPVYTDCIYLLLFIIHTQSFTYAKSVTETWHAIMSADEIISDQIHCHPQHTGKLWIVPNLHHYQQFTIASHIHLHPQPFIFINRHLSIDQMMVMTNTSDTVYK